MPASGRRDLAPLYAAMFKSASFVSFMVQRFKRPSNVWPHNNVLRDGALELASMNNGGLEGVTMAHFPEGLWLSCEESKVLCAGAKSEMQNVRIYPYMSL